MQDTRETFKINVDLEHSGNYSDYDDIQAEMKAKMDLLMRRIDNDPISIIPPNLAEGLVLAMNEAIAYR